MSEVTNSYGRCKPGLRFFVQDYPRISSHRPHNRVYTEKLSYKLSLVNSH